MPFCSRASLLLLPRQVPRRWAPGERLRFSFLVPTAGMEMAAWGKGRALTQGLVRGREMVYALTAVPRRGVLSLSFPKDPSFLGIPGLRLRPNSCHMHVAQMGWSCPVSICFQINLMSTLSSDLGCCK